MMRATLYAQRGVALRLFITCWIVYSLHFATNMVRENYLALAIGDHFSFRVDEYANMHDDIFEHPGYGWHIGSNPGASMLAAIPYALSRPVIDRIVDAVQRKRAETGTREPPIYDAPTDTDRLLYEEAWRRGFDVKFGLASFVMQSFAMAPVSALGVVLMYLLLVGWLGAPRTALWLALLYAFGTPVFLRTGFLNHNMMMAAVGLFGFAVLWSPWTRSGDAPGGPQRGAAAARRFFFAGLAGGMAVLLDYSGVILLVGLWLYGLIKYADWSDLKGVGRIKLAYFVGFIGPLALLWLYQWRSFGSPFLPPQHWMPSVPHIGEGYQGVGWPRLELARMLAFDYRFGLFVSCPLFLLALATPFANRGLEKAGKGPRLPRPELLACLGLGLAFFLFFSGVQYTRWQFNTGVRYLAPSFPFLFLLVVVVLRRLPGLAAWVVGVLSVALAWSMAMARDVSGGKVGLGDPDTGLGVLDPVLSVLIDGFQLPALTTLSRMEGYGILSSGRVSPLALFTLTAAILWLVWRVRR